MYEFEAPIELLDFGRMAYSVVYVPPAVLSSMPNGGSRVRVTGEVAGKPFDGACLPAGEGRFYLLLSKKYLKAARLEIGDRVFVSLRIADPDAVDIPPELQAAIDASAAVGRAWAELTPGKQRGLAYRVASAKRPETRQRRVDEVLEEIG